MKKIIATITMVFVMTVGLVQQAFAASKAPESAPLQDQIRLEVLMDLCQIKVEEKGWSVENQTIDHFSGDGRNVYIWSVTVTDPFGSLKSGWMILDESNLDACIKAIQEAS